MIIPQVSVRVNCDHYRYDSAAIAAGILMAGVAHGSLGCQVELGPFTSFKAAVESAQAGGWLVVERPAYASGDPIQLCYCPVHCGEAAEFWRHVREADPAAGGWCAPSVEEATKR